MKLVSTGIAETAAQNILDALKRDPMHSLEVHGPAALDLAQSTTQLPVAGGYVVIPAFALAGKFEDLVVRVTVTVATAEEAAMVNGEGDPADSRFTP